jgi:small subunit ribosomal protein S27e
MMTSGFIKAKCGKCKNEQHIFERPSMEVKCLVCGETIVRPTGGKVKLAQAAEAPEKN